MNRLFALCEFADIDVSLSDGCMKFEVAATSILYLKVNVFNMDFDYSEAAKRLINEILKNEMYPQISTAVTVTVFFLVCFFLVALGCKKLIRLIFAFRAMILSSSGVFLTSRLTLFCMQLASYFNSGYLIDNRIFFRVLELFKMLWNASLMLDELVVLVLSHELYLCTCKMRIRSKQVLVIIRKLIYATVVVMIIAAAPVFLRLPLGFTELTDFNTKWWVTVALTESNFWNTVTSIFVTGSVLYLSVHVFLSLKKK